MRYVQVSGQRKLSSANRPCSFGVKNGTSFVSGVDLPPMIVLLFKTPMSSRFGKRERKHDNSRGEQNGSYNVIDRNVCEKCLK